MPIDLPRLKAIVEKVGYHGFLPIEALGREATTRERVERVVKFLGQVKEVFFR